MSRLRRALRLLGRLLGFIGIGTLVCLVVFAAAVAVHYRSTPGEGQPLLRMPFPAGTVVMCNQANRSKAGRTHSYGNCLHALDFGLPRCRGLEVVAAAAGRVAYVVVGAAPLAVTPGRGFGDQVRIDHGGGYYTLYAHLDRIAVKVGDRVEAGALLGTIGESGNAGYPHLHWSLHRGAPEDDDPSWTVPIAGLVAADMRAERPAFRTIPGLELASTGAEWAAENGIYGSENTPERAPLTGTPTADLAAALARGAQRLSESLSLTGPAIQKEWPARGGAWARERYERIVAEDPGDLVAWYWIGVASRRDLADPARAKEAFARILAADLANVPAWLCAWSHVHVGIMAEAEGRAEDAAKEYAAALERKDDGSGFVGEARAGLARVRGAGK